MSNEHADLDERIELPRLPRLPRLSAAQRAFMYLVWSGPPPGAFRMYQNRTADALVRKGVLKAYARVLGVTVWRPVGIEDAAT